MHLLRGKVRDIARELIDGNPEANSSDLGDALAERLTNLAADGDMQAAQMLAAFERETGRQVMRKALKEHEPVVRVAFDGHIVSIPARLGNKERSADGERSGAYQYPLIYDLPWTKFEAMYEEHRHATNARLAETLGLEHILSLRDRFPSSRTPREAAQMAGWAANYFDFAANGN